MDEIDLALTTAWNRVVPRLQNDPDERRRRAFRRTQKTYARPLRAWCLCIRASDTRINAYNALIGPFKDLDQCRLPHTLTLPADTIRMLTAPVRIGYPPMPLDHAADHLGRSRGALAYWLRRGVFEVDYRPASTTGRKGKPVPWVWSPRPLDPNWCKGAGPDPHFGTLWQHFHKHVPDGYELKVKRVPVSNRRARRPGLTTFAGWKFICPGPPASGIRGNRPLLPCGRHVRRLYLPIPPLTLPDFLGHDPLDLPLAYDHGAVIPPAPAVEQASRLLPLPASLPSRLPPQFACRHCHNLRRHSLISDAGWDQFISHVTAGVLRGHEVAKPASLQIERKLPYVPHKRKAPRRDKVLSLFRQGLANPQIAQALGMSRHALDVTLGVLYRKHGVHSAAQLREKLGIPQPLCPRQSLALDYLLQDLTLSQIARRMGITYQGVRAHCKSLYRRYQVATRQELRAKLTFRRPTPPPPASRLNLEARNLNLES